MEFDTVIKKKSDLAKCQIKTGNRYSWFTSEGEFYWESGTTWLMWEGEKHEMIEPNLSSVKACVVNCCKTADPYSWGQGS